MNVYIAYRDLPEYIKQQGGFCSECGGEFK